MMQALMPRMIAVVLTLGALFITAAASAQMRAGSAEMPGPAAGNPGGQLSPCYQQCADQGSACAQNVRGARSGQDLADQCTAQMKVCAAICDATASSAPTTPDDSSAEATAMAPSDPVAAFERLLQTFLQADRRRLADADRRALTLAIDVMQILCNQMNVPTCTVGTGEAVLPARPLGQRSASERWSKVLPPKAASSTRSGTENRKSPSSSKKFDGCHLQMMGHVRGRGFDDRFMLDASIWAFFPTPQAGELVVKNTGRRTAWVGMSVALNVEVPAGGEARLPVVIYHAKDDDRPNETDLYVKYWTDSEKKCAGGGTQPGFTTPEEWGPTMVEEARHAIE